MTELSWEFQDPPSQADQRELGERLLAHGEASYGPPGFRPIGFFVRGEAGELVGGLTGRFRWGWLFVELLWVAPPHRRSGLGARLLSRAEAFARENGGVAVHLETGGSDALPFYAALGYEVVSALEGFPPGSRQHVMRKWLADPRPSLADELAVLRQGFAGAEMRGDATFFERLLADDATIQPPGAATCVGKAACLDFIRGVFADLGAEFTRDITCTSSEVQGMGDWAFDRGIFAQRLVRRTDGEEIHETGKYLWLYRRGAGGGWRLARIIGNYDWRGEEEEEEEE